MARKAELARASRRRKKTYVNELEDKISALSADIAALEAASGNGGGAGAGAGSGGSVPRLPSVSSQSALNAIGLGEFSTFGLDQHPSLHSQRAAHTGSSNSLAHMSRSDSGAGRR